MTGVVILELNNGSGKDDMIFFPQESGGKMRVGLGCIPAGPHQEATRANARLAGVCIIFSVWTSGSQPS